MKKTIVLIGATILAATSPGYGQLKVDFDVVDAGGALVPDSITEFGFESFGAQNQTSGQPYDLFRTATFSTPSWGNLNVTLSSDANPAASDYAQVPRAIARTATQVGAYNGTLLDLVREWAGIDTRATNAAPTKLNLTFSALPPGQYELVSYHQDAADQDGRFDVLVNGTQVATNLQIHSSSAGQNPGPGNPPFYVLTRFTSDGSSPTTVSFRMTTTNSASASERLMVLNGFILANRGQGLLVYSFDATPPAVFEGQTTTLSWVTRSNATVFIDLIGDVTASTANGVGSITFNPSLYASAGTTNTVTLTAQDTNTFEGENRSLQIRVLRDLESLEASPRVIQPGQSSTLSWLANPAATISIDPGVGNVNAQTDSAGNGSVSVSPSVTTTYTISVTRNGITSQTNATVVVVPSGGTGTLTNGLISYWPLDEDVGGKTPDIVSGYDLTLEGSTPPTLTASGYRSNAFSFSGGGLLYRISSADDQLPANKHTAFTISLWAKVDGPPLDDKRIFCEGSTVNNNPLFDMGTMGGLSGDLRGTGMSVFIRQADGTVENNHTYTSGTAFDDTWHHIVMVQSNGVRTVYLDAVQDSTPIASATSDWYTNVFNVTAVGGIRRSSGTAFITGTLDDVAIWDRALSPTEIGDVYVHGMPDLGAARAPLTINSFKADFPAVAAGDTVTLRWDVSPDASLSIDSGVGNVDNVTTYGVGSIAVPVNSPTQFTLTASRSGDTPVMKTVSVSVVHGVTAGWHLLDNFETYQPGPILGQSKWNNGTGVASVLDRGGNKVLAFTSMADDIRGAGLLAAIPLDSLSLSEGQIGTLFFRLYASDIDPASDMTVHMGLTDRPARFVGDFANNIGPYLRLEKPAASITNITLLAPDGVGAAWVVASNTLAYEKIYNVWIDVTNDTIASNDLFSVYVQEQGATSRTLLFRDLRGDRDPVADETGPVQPTLNKVFFALMNLNQGQDNLLIDDLFLSRGEYLDTVPTAPGAFAQNILLSEPGSVSGGFTFSWNSQAGVTYTVRAKANLADPWQILATNYPAGGATGPVTSYTDSPLVTPQGFYQAVAEPRPAIWSDDFESGSDGWTVIDNSFGASPTVWEWGTPSNGPGAAHSGTEAFGTGLNTDYAQYTDTSLRSPIIDLTGVTNQVRLEFWQYVNVDQEDYCQVNILDQYDTILVSPVSTQSGSNGGWKLLTYPLPATALNQPIKIEFHMADADYYNAQPLPGWFIDDVSIRR